MDVCCDPRVEQVTIMSSAQVGKTEAINNIVGYYIDQDPSPILIIFPTLEISSAWSKDRLEPMIRDTPAMRDKVGEQKAKSTSSTILHKRFAGGHLTIAGANSPSSLASRPIRIVLCDEVDLFPGSIGVQGAEGDPVKLAFKRTQTFWNRKIILTSTPTTKNVSRIEFAYQQSDMRRYYVGCTKCGELQTLEWSGVKFDSANLTWAYYECVGCKTQIMESEKIGMVREGEWKATRPEIVKHAGFHISELYSPWSSMHRIAEDFLEAKKRRETLRVWVNKTLGETFEEDESFEISDEEMLKRVEHYEDIPAGGLILTAGIDVQDDRIECIVRAWGIGEESWLIEWQRFYGSPGREDTWRFVEHFLQKRWKHESGLEMDITSTFIDTGGHFTKTTYLFIKRLRAKKIRAFGVKGLGGSGKPFMGKLSRNNRERVPVMILGVDAGKELVYDRLTNNDDGPGKMHFSGVCTAEYFQQLTSEKKVTKFDKGFPRIVWVLKSGKRNEVLDMEVYALGAFAFLNADMVKIAELHSKKIEHTATTKEVADEQKTPKSIVRKISGGSRRTY